jgi:hypothetical protein
MLFLCEDVPDVSETDYAATYRLIAENIDIFAPPPSSSPPPPPSPPQLPQLPTMRKRRCSIEAVIDAMYLKETPSADDIPRPTTRSTKFEFSLCLLPLKDAAAHIGVSETKLKNTARALGIERWPHRRLRKIHKVVLAAETNVSRKFVRQAVLDSLYNNEIDMKAV